jgi:hypothetical protein
MIAAMSAQMPESASTLPGGYLQRLLLTLSEAGVDYVVCGGVACVLQGVDRVTKDIDLSIRLDDENLGRFIPAVEQLGFRPRIPEPLRALLDPRRRRAWIEEKQAKVLTLEAPDHPFQIDVFLEYAIDHNRLRADATELAIGSVSVPVSSIEHLIAAKRAVTAVRTIDRRDIEDLEELLRRGRSTES